jgi:acetyl-CoA acyltransferase 1
MVKTTKIDPKNIQDITVGNVLQSGAGVMQARMAQYLAGFPDSVTTVAINRFCSSGLEAVAQVAAKIKAGMIDVGVAGGVENMSMYDMQASVNPELISEAVFENESARNCMMPMGQTSEVIKFIFKQEDFFF